MSQKIVKPSISQELVGFSRLPETLEKQREVVMIVQEFYILYEPVHLGYDLNSTFLEAP